jgi:hypothetical protein
VRVGATAEGHAETENGATWLVGGDAGYVFVPPPNYAAIGVEAYINAGFPLQDGLYDGYAGAGFSLPIDVGSDHPHSDRNRAYYPVSRRIAIVPDLRYRVFWRHDPNLASHNVTGGVLVRIRLASDVL